MVVRTRSQAASEAEASGSKVTKAGWQPQPQNAYTPMRVLEVIVGTCIFFGALPLVVCQIVVCTFWEWLDKHTINLIKFAAWFNETTAPLLKWAVKNPADAFVVNTFIWLGVLMPYYFYLEFVNTVTNGFDWKRAALYNILRIGPMYMHFMYVYVLCHKESHCYGRIFSSPLHYIGQFAWNWWVGLFHGVLPGTFVYSHIANHHKYDNEKDDVYSTGAFPRDSFVNFLRYVCVWFMYALNLSTLVQFYKEGKLNMVCKTLYGTGFYIAFVSYFYYHHPTFALTYLIYPLIEANILLGMVNYTWHAFIDPLDHQNDYVNSTTILEGLNFTLREEYHVVHHQYAGIHWTRHQEKYQKHIDEYKKRRATLFYKANIFEIWGMCVFKQYDALAEKFVQLEEDPKKRLSDKEVSTMLKDRLQTTTWSY
eukprot:TRINITY_DN32804_c0_g1_i1.p1 TRINITY_DN32804_c0_g1~~TRINITY_DN32804_c0_g1_i1.p1  ORF type:complete len:423 (-),score=92.72 TRINITY_DN32804_c0_g1_i1:332-1600(-)